MKAIISRGNKKIGKTWNVSLPPLLSCRGDVPCRKDCYALKAYKAYPTARAAWDNNLNTYLSDPDGYFQDITDQIDQAKNKPRFFRWHVSGDIPCQHYFDGIKALAAQFPQIRFLAFTKRYNFNYSKLPKNLSIVLSAWPGLPMQNRYRLPVAYMQDGTEKRVKNALECPGGCDKCGMCWQLKEVNKNVVFHKH